jgi:predicted alpha-1,2-mannosidase
MHILFWALANLVAVAAPTSLVDTFVGSSGTPVGGPIDTFPGADVPFGMVQWSPDTPSQNAGGGYEYGDKQITGFSLTHLSGPGCNVFGDFGVLPTVGQIPEDPQDAAQPFSHATEESAPGWYAVSLGIPAVRAELTVTKRTGIGRFTFPAASQANLLFNASSNQAGVTDANITVDSPNEISGSASSGFFCGMPDRYTVFFVARFDRPFRQYGTWNGRRISLGSGAARGPETGMWLTFDTMQDRTVTVKVGVSFVNIAGARANLAAENRGWSPIAVRDAATDAWSEMLRRIAISGGPTDRQRTFYTALYHALLHPNVISDVTGLYTGFDGKIHPARAGHDEYANFSDWDIYRTEVPLLALIAPRETSDMMQSLVDAFAQEGWLPRWPLVNGPTSVMGGDSVDPVIAGAYAFGARNFNARAALVAAVKGATSVEPPFAQGWYVERWELRDEYLSRGYVVNSHTTSVSPVPNGASETLEYALDDFAIARLAYELHDMHTYDTFLRRSSNWTTLFDGATGEIAPRDADGAFMQTPLTENGQSGFQEGNSAQYTWMVPQDLRDLIAAMGGTRAAVAKLDAFFGQLDAGQDKPYAWLGNEPSLGTPWVYLSAGEPWRAQAIVRQALTSLYSDTPAGLPGNDDLGTMSAWYLWCAMGLYPQNPAVRYLDVGAPLFSSVRVQSPGGPLIEIHAPQDDDGDLYVQQLRVDGRASNQTWVSLPYAGTLRLDFRLGASPNARWGSLHNDVPPSYAAGHLTLPPSSAAVLAAPPGVITVPAGGTAPLEFQISNRGGDKPTAVTWRAAVPDGLHLHAPLGKVSLSPGNTLSIASQLSADAKASDAFYAVRIDASADGVALEHLNLTAHVTHDGPGAALAYAVNRFGNSITPIDLATHARLPEIAVGEEPRGAALSPDGKRLYVADSGANAVTVVDTTNRRAIATVKVGSTPMGIAMEPDGRKVWVVNNGDGTIESIDLATLRVETTLPVGSHPRAVAIAPDGSMLYVSNSWSNSVTPVDLRSKRAGTEIPVGLRPAGLAIAPDGQRLYVVDSASNDVTPVDLSGKGRVFAPIAVGVDPLEIAIAPNGSLAYVTNHANSTITPIDLPADAARAPIQVGGAPYGAVFTRDSRSAIVVLSRDNAFVVVNAASSAVSNAFQLGNGPYAIVAP